jgi:hypothetical protein
VQNKATLALTLSENALTKDVLKLEATKDDVPLYLISLKRNGRVSPFLAGRNYPSYLICNRKSRDWRDCAGITRPNLDGAYIRGRFSIIIYSNLKRIGQHHVSGKGVADSQKRPSTRNIGSLHPPHMPIRTNTDEDQKASKERQQHIGEHDPADKTSAPMTPPFVDPGFSLFLGRVTDFGY